MSISLSKWPTLAMTLKCFMRWMSSTRTTSTLPVPVTRMSTVSMTDESFATW